MKTFHGGIFHSVGQGLFYSAELILDQSAPSPFRYIVDCGSEGTGRLRDAVNAYLASIPGGSTLDLLFLTHLHKDHVSGVDQLLKGVNGVKQVVLPYLYPWERACLLAVAQESEFYVDDPPGWYLRFLKEPAKFLFEAGAREVIFVRGGDEPEGQPVLDLPTNPLGDRREGQRRFPEIHLKGVPLDARQTEEFREAEANAHGDDLTGRVQFVNTRYPLHVAVWTFILFNAQMEPEKIQRLRQGFIAIPGASDLGMFLRTRENIDTIAALYKSIFGDSRLNETSLALFSGYVVRGLSRFGLKSAYTVGHRQVASRFGTLPAPPIKAVGFLFTGDLFVNRVWPEFARKFGQDGSAALVNLVYQVPHHGSDHNWGPEQLTIHTDPVYVISVGVRNRYGHPGQEVLRALFSANKQSATANETQAVGHTLAIEDVHP